MKSYYLILRIRPETDFQGKSENEILKKIEANYKALMTRGLNTYPEGVERENAIKELDEAKSVLSDPKKRQQYDEQFKLFNEKLSQESVTIEIEELTDEMIEEINKEIEEENRRGE